MAHPATIAFAFAGAIGVTALQAWGFVAATHGGGHEIAAPSLMASAGKAEPSLTLRTAMGYASMASVPIPGVPPITNEATAFSSYGQGPEIVITGTVDNRISEATGAGYTSALAAPEAKRPLVGLMSHTTASRFAGDPQ